MDRGNRALEGPEIFVAPWTVQRQPETLMAHTLADESMWDCGTPDGLDSESTARIRARRDDLDRMTPRRLAIGLTKRTG